MTPEITHVADSQAAHRLAASPVERFFTRLVHWAGTVVSNRKLDDREKALLKQAIAEVHAEEAEEARAKKRGRKTGA